MDVRLVSPSDRDGVERVVLDAFGEEGRPIVTVLDHLRAREDVRAELVAEDEGSVVGYVALSRAWLDARERLVDVLVLSPLAVLPDRQRQGIGAELLAAACRAGETLGAPLVFLEGDPRYYSRLGWEASAGHGIERPSARIPEPACQLVLLGAYESWMTGRLVYPDAWWRLDLVGLRDPLLAELEGGAGAVG
ncbi:MAG: GNAT family N-acetyltransferase [Nocardioides sp.]|uniref:GNAT family N-acetyltransferase n=1 Tax=Nocardioides sp. TaxID=35761 RepID=UPI003F0A1269